MADPLASVFHAVVGEAPFWMLAAHCTGKKTLLVERRQACDSAADRAAVRLHPQLPEPSCPPSAPGAPRHTGAGGPTGTRLNCGMQMLPFYVRELLNPPDSPPSAAVPACTGHHQEMTEGETQTRIHEILPLRDQRSHRSQVPWHMQPPPAGTESQGL